MRTDIGHPEYGLKGSLDPLKLFQGLGSRSLTCRHGQERSACRTRGQQRRQGASGSAERREGTAPCPQSHQRAWDVRHRGRVWRTRSRAEACLTGEEPIPGRAAPCSPSSAPSCSRRPDLILHFGPSRRSRSVWSPCPNTSESSPLVLIFPASAPTQANTLSCPDDSVVSHLPHCHPLSAQQRERPSRSINQSLPQSAPSLPTESHCLYPGLHGP